MIPRRDAHDACLFGFGILAGAGLAAWRGAGFTAVVGAGYVALALAHLAWRTYRAARRRETLEQLPPPPDLEPVPLPPEPPMLELPTFDSALWPCPKCGTYNGEGSRARYASLMYLPPSRARLIWRPYAAPRWEGENAPERVRHTCGGCGYAVETLPADAEAIAQVEEPRA